MDELKSKIFWRDVLIIVYGTLIFDIYLGLSTLLDNTLNTFISRLIAVILIVFACLGFLCKNKNAPEFKIGFTKVNYMSKYLILVLVPVIFVNVLTVGPFTKTTTNLGGFLILTFLTAFAEELFFRSLGVAVFKKDDKLSNASFVALILIYALSHIVNYFFYSPSTATLQIIFALGLGSLLLGLYVKTKNIWLVITINAVTNFFGGIYELYCEKTCMQEIGTAGTVITIIMCILYFTVEFGLGILLFLDSKKDSCQVPDGIKYLDNNKENKVLTCVENDEEKTENTEESSCLITENDENILEKNGNSDNTEENVKDIESSLMVENVVEEKKDIATTTINEDSCEIEKGQLNNITEDSEADSNQVGETQENGEIKVEEIKTIEQPLNENVSKLTLKEKIKKMLTKKSQEKVEEPEIHKENNVLAEENIFEDGNVNNNVDNFVKIKKPTKKNNHKKKLKKRRKRKNNKKS